MIAALLGFALAAAAPADPGPPPYLLKLDAPTASDGFVVLPKEDGFRCSTGFGECWRLIRGEDRSYALQYYDMDPSVAVPSGPIALPGHVALGDAELWGQVIRLNTMIDGSGGGATNLVGIIKVDFEGYSGGFASTKRLHLFPFIPSEEGPRLGAEVLSLPWTAETQIRACFGTDDAQNRRGECSDIYRFTPTIALDPAGRASAMPGLIYSAVATAYPRTSRRGEDSSAKAPLTEADLTEWRDPACSFARRFALSPLTGRYEADQPGPAGCEDRWTIPR